MAPTEASDMVECLQIQDRRFRVGKGVVADTQFLGFAGDVREELTVRFRTVGAELVQDLCQGGVWHGDLEQMVKKGNLWEVWMS